jgi:hypothetical protein
MKKETGIFFAGCTHGLMIDSSGVSMGHCVMVAGECRICSPSGELTEFCIKSSKVIDGNGNDTGFEIGNGFVLLGPGTVPPWLSCL